MLPLDIGALKDLEKFVMDLQKGTHAPLKKEYLPEMRLKFYPFFLNIINDNQYIQTDQNNILRNTIRNQIRQDVLFIRDNVICTPDNHIESQRIINAYFIQTN
jgi:hypothetical protein